MGKQKTIRDVAELAGVSVATASRVLNDSSYPVRPQLRQRVKEAAEKLEYSPNIMAQSLRKETNRDIALIIPNISNPFYLQAVLGVGEALSSRDYNMIFCNTMHDPERERNFLRQLYERQVKGVILSSVAAGTAELVQKFMQRGMKFVLLDQMLSDVESPGGSLLPPPPWYASPGRRSTQATGRLCLPPDSPALRSCFTNVPSAR